MNERYLEIMLNVPDAFLGRMTAILMKRIHHVISFHNLNIGVSFPQYSNEEDQQTTGSIIRCFGDMQSLKKLWNDNVLSEHECSNDISVDLLVTPDNYEKVKFLRDRTVDNYRSIKNDRVIQPENYPIIKMNSKSTDQFFIIHLKKMVVDTEENTWHFNSYGLSNKLENSWVPDF